MWAALSGKMNEVPFPTGAASGPRLGGRDLGVFVGPEVERKHGAAKIVRGCSSHENLDCLSRGDRSHQTHGRVENARRLAGLNHSSWRIRKDARAASCLTRYHI